MGAMKQEVIEDFEKTEYGGATRTSGRNADHGLVEPGYRKAYALSGKAILTLEGKSKRFTYSVEIKDMGTENLGATHWVYLLRGPDNTSDFEFLGGIVDQHKRFYVSPKSRLSASSPATKAFAWFWTHIEDTQVSVYHAGTCGRCGRLLTTPESVQRGLGPECSKRETGR